ncbi:MAG: hypothetical protein A3B38_03425 [Candidatus Levybacteria bacterium RIFCSPLOWO2_01_FULL_36_13]|nr:MAG: hypothetical protein A2684_04370 [Candidatus Levybacteria bacterium RIFCSPHIGHO2_01_FULL_36_15b]OGH34727.1 MAG: hypothetical protein A3B38_03425 [Candidatus Levybacteria bacterium RIFCSPLOWO2_01_FULL_36_13]
MVITKSTPFTKEEIEKRNKQILGALAMDLKRVALSYYRGSDKTAEVFYKEALKRRNELDKKDLKPYLTRFLSRMESLQNEKKDKAAENALLYSTIFQNASHS